MAELEAVAPEALIEERVRGVQEVPLHRFLGMEIESITPGRATIRLPANGPGGNNVGVVHGGVLYALLDAVMYLSAVPLVAADRNVLTHDIHCSVLRPAPLDQPITFEGKVLRAGRALFFGESTAHCGSRLVARATVTKSVVPAPASAPASGQPTPGQNA